MKRAFLPLAWCVLAIVPGCSDAPQPTADPAPAGLSGLPVELTVAQRSTTPVPGSEGRLELTLDDITAGQVAVSLATSDAETILPVRSMREGDATDFHYRGATLRLRLLRLHNLLLGQDSAEFRIEAAPPAGLPEDEKIERLIESIAAMPAAVFIRNGSEHRADEAAEHLRRKWKAAGGVTAEQFIERIASRSSLSGQPYLIRHADGTQTTAEEFFRGLLVELEGSGLASTEGS